MTELMNLYQVACANNGQGGFYNLRAMVDNDDYHFQAQLSFTYDKDWNFLKASICMPITDIFTGRKLQLTKKRKELLEKFISFNKEFVKDNWIKNKDKVVNHD